jgi:N-acetylglutamate synthase-like GNAT family acetyltransferase
MITIRKAAEEDMHVLSKKLMALLENKNSRFYQENVTKFGIPEEYVKKALAEEKLLMAVVSGKTDFYLALINNKIIGFAQTEQRDSHTAELDRILVFPKHSKKSVGTQLLKQTIADHKKKGIKKIIVKTGEAETHARRFYEKNGFEKIKEEIVTAPWGKKLDLVIYEVLLETT